MDNTLNQKIADLLFPDVTKTLDDLEKTYPPRQLPEHAEVTRFAPSPTGFLHIGGTMTALVEERIAHQSGGIFILRVEDTDKKREVAGGVDEIALGLRAFDIIIDEGVWSSTEQLGNHGPYLQSQRREIYAICAKYLVSQGLAYPCFCTPEELAASRQEQIDTKVPRGYYGKWAKHRDTTFEEIENNLAAKKPFAIRLKSHGDPNTKITFKDEIKGSLTVTENYIDYILYKADGLPTYHFAHPVDDHFMRITLVLRADEWLPSTPLHIEIFRAFGWKLPKFAHNAPIMKFDGNGKRKLSKRKDPETNVMYFLEEGYPLQSIQDYALNLTNSNFEEWRKQHPDTPNTEFKLSLQKINKSGAILNLAKLDDVSKQVIARYSPDKIYDAVLAWSTKFDPEFAQILTTEKDYTIKILSIEKDQKGKRKDIAKWSQVRDYIGYMYDSEFDRLAKDGFLVPEGFDIHDIIHALISYQRILHTSLQKEKAEWFTDIKAIATEIDYTTDTKAYRADPSEFKGYVGDIATFLRIALTNRTNTPDLQEIMQVLGEERTQKRIEKYIAYLKTK